MGGFVSCDEFIHDNWRVVAFCMFVGRGAHWLVDAVARHLGVPQLTFVDCWFFVIVEESHL